MHEASDPPTFWDPTIITCLFFTGLTILVRKVLSTLLNGVAYSHWHQTYDYICTLDQEVEFAWPCPPSLGMLLFYFNRYVPFIDQSVSLYREFLLLSVILRVQTSIVLCSEAFYESARGFICFGIFISQLIITLRTCAIWGARRRVTIPLAALAVATIALFASQEAKLLSSLQFIHGNGRGCYIKPGPGKVLDLVFLPNFISDFVAITLTTIKAYQHFRLSCSSWLNQFYRDGLLYCAFILVLGLINIISPTFPVPLYYKAVMHSPTRVFHSIFCNRVMLLILKQRHDMAQRGRRPEVTGDGETMQMFSTVFTEIITSGNTSTGHNFINRESNAA
ncbi:uncharacterized protein LACBIDRAFT_303605 [Laccaria bicolor S238N-H82]|uniref:Predicted protein n=1 Tax=Laccaria bicolor (strain S238N-H82 / ATCC MYA-4686) TaxID=486041 RepID=B0DJU4_LACBS|nr:uncharacterized protein LACBIDRAFT_303605 [Laccaria bicolor S238N-H82]EDR05180.1 predicted protein [Laccaria bicolor S238N-H82]|eukprot:XP_001884145.1 predicted protein [Laccaria bicolor S238N-H82]